MRYHRTLRPSIVLYSTVFRWNNSGGTHFQITDLIVVYSFLGIILHTVTISGVTAEVIEKMFPGRKLIES